MISFKQLGNYGRLGNQLFEISATIALALRNGDKYAFPRWKYEDSFNLKNCFYDTIDSKCEFIENGFHYKEIPYHKDMDLKGFFQSEKYFIDNKGVILGLLTPKNQPSIKWGYTSIHVRRGDYTSLKNEYHQLDMSYYQAAMNIVKSDRYMIVSDDISWCKANFKGDQFYFSESNDEVTDLILQISCENNIIANSSFSWWGAYLNKNPLKMVIAPNKWFGPKLPHDVKDLLPTEWIKI